MQVITFDMFLWRSCSFMSVLLIVGVTTDLTDCTRIRNHNHLVRERTIDHLAKLDSLAKHLSVHLRTK